MDSPPRGYTVDHDKVGEHRDGTPRRWPRWVRDPEWEEAVDYAWRMRLQGGSYTAILRSTNLYRSRNSLVTFFGNPVYCGFPNWWLNHYDLEVADCINAPFIVEPYVSVPQWLKVQQDSGRKLAPRSIFSGWPLVGMGVCGYCGSAVIAHAYAHSRKCDQCGARWPTATSTCPNCGTDYSHRDGFHRYLCGLRNRRVARCPESRYVGGRKLEIGLLKELMLFFTPERMMELRGEVNAALAALHRTGAARWEQAQADLLAAQAAADNLAEAIKQAGPSPALLASVRDTDQELSRMKAELATLPSPRPVPCIEEEEVAALTGLFQEEIFSVRRNELHHFFKGINLRFTLWKDHAEAQFDWPPLGMLLNVPLYDCLYPQGGVSL